jgi:RNA polymerase sigma-B factor
MNEAPCQSELKINVPTRGGAEQLPGDPALDGLPPVLERLTRVPSDENELVRLYAETRDPRLREKVIERFLPLARSLALRYRGSSEQLDDLMQVASLGLLKALDRFDPRRGNAFVAYAAPSILGELRRHFRDRVWELRLPRGLQERTMAVEGAATALSHELGRSPTPSEIAQRLELSEEEVTDALQADQARRTLSLDAPGTPGDQESTPIVETIGGIEAGYEAVEAQATVDEVELSEREVRVLKLRFQDDLTQHEIGELIGVSQMQVSRIMRGALSKLLAAVREPSPDEAAGTPIESMGAAGFEPATSRV